MSEIKRSIYFFFIYGAQFALLKHLFYVKYLFFHTDLTIILSRKLSALRKG